MTSPRMSETEGRQPPELVLVLVLVLELELELEVELQVMLQHQRHLPRMM